MMPSVSLTTQVVPLLLFSHWLFPCSHISPPDNDGVTFLLIFSLVVLTLHSAFFVMNILTIHFPLFLFSHDPLSLQS